MGLEDLLGDDNELENELEGAEGQDGGEGQEPPEGQQEGQEGQEGSEGGEPEGQEGQEGDEGKDKPPKGYVPHAALHEERQQRKQMQQQLQETQQKIQQFEQLQNELQQYREQQRQQSQQSEEQLYQEDPIGYLRQQNERLQGRLQEFEQGIHQTQESYQQAQQQQQAVQELVSQVRAQEDQFRQQYPDYDHAFNHLQNTIMEDYDLYGINDPAQKQQAFYQQVLHASVQALQQERNPAEVMYELARRRGYNPQSGQQGNGQDDPNAQKLKNVEKGQQASTTLSEGSGGSPSRKGAPSLTDIEQMSDDEFDKFWDELSKSARKG